MACRVEGSPVAEVRWYKDGTAILPHAHAHIMLQGRDTLVLTGVGERDSGVYQCVAANSVGEAQAASHLNIRGKFLESCPATAYFPSLCPVSAFHPFPCPSSASLLSFCLITISFAFFSPVSASFLSLYLFLASFLSFLFPPPEPHH